MAGERIGEIVTHKADASRLEAGSIVRIENPVSSSGRATHGHYFIIVFIPASIRPGSLILLVGVSSSVPRTSLDPARHVAMKWLARPGGDPETGFSRLCHACVDFTHVLEVYAGEQFTLEVAAEHRGHFVRADKLQTIAAAYNAWMRKTGQ